MFGRSITPLLLAALRDSPVVVVNGARQSGKSTLVQAIANKHHAARYLTLDDTPTLSAAASDPQGFAASLDGNVVIDEVQRVPDLFRAIKLAVDRQRKPGRFLLTGSANVLMLPRLSESLAGRVEILTLWPLSQSEIESTATNLIDTAFTGKLARLKPGPLSRRQLTARMIRGGYPEAVSRTDDRRRAAWFESYLLTILQRDIRDLANIEGLTDLPRLLSLMAARSATLLNFAELSRTAGLAQTTLKRYFALLLTTFLVTDVPAWSANLSKRLVKTPKIYLNDSGLMAHLLGYDTARLANEPGLPGALLETFVQAELRKQLGWSDTSARLMHYRTATGVEVDFILENRAGEIVGIEVKASHTVEAKDFNGIRNLQESVPKKFLHGIVLYTGREAVPFGTGLTAIPVSALWC